MGESVHADALIEASRENVMLFIESAVQDGALVCVFESHRVANYVVYADAL